MDNNTFENELRKLLAEHDKEIIETALETFICELINSRILSTNDDMYYEMLGVKDNLIKEKFPG